MVFVKLPEPPGDGTTALRFAPDGSSLLASSSVHSFDTLGDCRTGDASPDAVPVPLLDLLPEYGDLPADLAG